MDLIETFVTCDPNVGSCTQLNGLIKTCFSQKPLGHFQPDRVCKSNRKAMNRNWNNQNKTLLLKPKWEINKITYRPKTLRTHGQPSEQLFPKRWPLSNPNRNKSTMNKHNFNITETLTPKQATETTLEPPPWNGH